MWLEPCFIKEELLTLVIQDVKKQWIKVLLVGGRWEGRKQLNTSLTNIVSKIWGELSIWGWWRYKEKPVELKLLTLKLRNGDLHR